MTTKTTIAIVFIVLLAGHIEAEDIPALSDDSVIIVSADESWEDADRDAIHFSGNFEIRTPRWTVRAEMATVYGKLDDPHRIVANGSPVQFIYRRSEENGASITEGKGQHLEYQRRQDLLRLKGDARLVSGGRIMRSNEILYDLEQQRLQAGGSEGVKITIKPDDNGKF